MSVYRHYAQSVERKYFCLEKLGSADKVNRYKPHVKLRFVTEELGFESDDESARFICDHGAQQYLEERETGVVLLTGKVLNFFDSALTAASAKPDSKVYI